VAEGIPARLSIGEARRFGLVVGPAFLVLGALLWWRGRPSSPLVFGAIGTALVFLGVVLPAALVPVRRVWMGAAVGISKVTTPILMGVVYFGVLTPIGMVRRLLGHTPLKPQPGGDSLWVVRDLHARKPEDMEHQF
jgi:polyferredoxin